MEGCPAIDDYLHRFPEDEDAQMPQLLYIPPVDSSESGTSTTSPFSRSVESVSLPDSRSESSVEAVPAYEMPSSSGDRPRRVPGAQGPAYQAEAGFLRVCYLDDEVSVPLEGWSLTAVSLETAVPLESWNPAKLNPFPDMRSSCKVLHYTKTLRATSKYMQL